MLQGHVACIMCLESFGRLQVESSRSFRDYSRRPRGRSLSFATFVRESVKLGFSPVHCGELVSVITLAGQSAVWDR